MNVDGDGDDDDGGDDDDEEEEEDADEEEDDGETYVSKPNVRAHTMCSVGYNGRHSINCNCSMLDFIVMMMLHNGTCDDDDDDNNAD